MKLTGGGLVTSTLDSVRMANRGTDRSIRVVVGSGAFVNDDGLPTTLWSCPFPPQPGLSPGSKSEVQTYSTRLCVFYEPVSVGFFAYIIFMYLLISLVMNNIVSTLQM